MRKAAVFIFSIIILFISVTKIYAAGPTSTPSTWGCEIENVATIKCFEVIFVRILTIIPPLALVALFVMLLIGGFKYMTSGGNPKTTASAKQTLTFAFAGIILLVFAYLIFLLIQHFTGVDILLFHIPDKTTQIP